jgi:hypothetical protein
LLQSRQFIDEGHWHGGAPDPGDLLGLRRRCKDTDLFALKSAKNPGGAIYIWMEPSCVPSIMRGVEPSWLAG